MKSLRSQPDPIRTFKRKSTRARRVGSKTSCPCGETRLEALIGNSGECAECQRRRKGQSAIDNHHFAGIANSPTTVRISANDHRAVMSLAQYDWPRQTLENLEASPLLAAAGSVRGLADLNFLISELSPRNAELLEALDIFLTTKLGPRWWRDTPINEFTPKEKKR